MTFDKHFINCTGNYLSVLLERKNNNCSKNKLNYERGSEMTNQAIYYKKFLFYLEKISD